MIPTGPGSESPPPRGSLALVLHAHLPWVRHPEHPEALEERWLFEAITECYLPLISLLRSQLDDGIPGTITLGVTPPLLAMLDDELLRERYARHLDRQCELAGSEAVRRSTLEDQAGTARFLLARLEGLRDNYRACGGDLARALRHLRDRGKVELIASAATHAYLPLLRDFPESIRAQIRVGVESYRRAFGEEPAGFWLPECAYFRGLERFLEESGIRYFFVETHAVRAALPDLVEPELRPLRCPNGVVALARDPVTSLLVWSAEVGYPGDPEYLEFHRDAGLELPADLLGSLGAPPGARAPVGLKYHRITGPTEVKQPYRREVALERVEEHARDFVDRLHRRLPPGGPGEEGPPLIVAPYDAELFGHWWFEGPEWLDRVVRGLARRPGEVDLDSPSSHLDRYPPRERVRPVESSWGRGGFHLTWLNEKNSDLSLELRRAHREAREEMAVEGGESPSGELIREARAALIRQLLLLSSSDWPFLRTGGTAGEYPVHRFGQHRERFERILQALREARESEGEKTSIARLKEILREVDALDGIFPWLEASVLEPAPTPNPSPESPRMQQHIVFLSAEATPWAKAGGLGDVCGALPAALARQGARVTLILPAYGFLDAEKFGIHPRWTGLSIGFDGAEKTFRVLEARSPAEGVRVLLVDFPWFFDREGVYVDPGSGEEYPDSADRFLFFSKASLEALCHLGERVDVLHCHDHQTAMALGLLRLKYEGQPVFEETAGIFTLHNLGYQGQYGPEVLDRVGIGREWFYPLSPFEFYGGVNLMKIGIELADKVNAVSERYAEEICEGPEAGAGLQDVLRARGEDLVGILNGIEVEVWDPANDPHLPASYDAADPTGKEECKRALLEEMGLDVAELERVPLFGMVTRLVDQKGLDLLAQGLDELLGLGVNLAILGTGLPKYHDFLQEARERHPGRLGVALQFDNGLAHRIEAGADFFLMPSLYEPCGLNQLYSLRYGTIPVVRETGGLADTVPDVDRDPLGGLGFSFRDYDVHAMLDACRRAVARYHDREVFVELRRRAMEVDHSWEASARKYLALYGEALGRRRQRLGRDDLVAR